MKKNVLRVRLFTLYFIVVIYDNKNEMSSCSDEHRTPIVPISLKEYTESDTTSLGSLYVSEENNSSNYASRDSDLVLPTQTELASMMRSCAEILYRAWKSELSKRLLQFEMYGDIDSRDLYLSMRTWRLPNNEIRHAQSLLEKDLAEAGYDYNISFHNAESPDWFMSYKICFNDNS